MRQLILFIFLSTLLSVSAQKKAATSQGFVGVKKFNEIHKKDFFKIFSKSDTIKMREDYKVSIVIDTSIIKNVGQIKVFVNDIEAKRKKNIFRQSAFIYRFSKGIKTIKLKIVYPKDKAMDTIKTQFDLYFIVTKNNSTNVDYIGYAEPMPRFASKKHTTFKNYLYQSAITIGIHLKGKMLLDYTVMENGKLRIDGIQSDFIDYLQEDKLKKEWEKFSDWIPGVYEGRKRNVKIFKQEFNF
ncbi:MAG: hypothetical protein IPG89_00695 [Bacteroidetes bacterium]|nr:hypothetical protein [Bacteroidota bacterium]